MIRAVDFETEIRYDQIIELGVTPMKILACLIEPMDFNGHVVCWAVGEDEETAIAALKEKAIGSTFHTVKGRTEVDEDFWDRIRATYDGDMDDEETGLLLQVCQ